MTQDENQAIIQFVARKDSIVDYACGCLGPLNGAPLCPCAMKYVELVNGKYYRISSKIAEDGINSIYKAELIGYKKTTGI